MRQHTLKGSFELSGKGLHTGRVVTLRLNPASEGTGLIIRRTDLTGKSATREMRAIADYVCATERGTVLKNGDCIVSTVEHCLSALYALNVDNCLIEVDGPEFPILDGSAAPYVREIMQVGIEEQMAERQDFVVTREITFARGESSIRLTPSDDFTAEVTIGFDSPVLTHQVASLRSTDEYASQVASCRTFVFVREIEQLIQAGLIKGGDLNNALVIYDRETSRENLDKIAAACGQKIDGAFALGYINGPLKFDNEPARHKLLDLLGDIALTGVHIRGKIEAVHPGHGVNTAFAAMFRKENLN